MAAAQRCSIVCLVSLLAIGPAEEAARSATSGLPGVTASVETWTSAP
jgi:hypothetical protein